MKAVVGIDYGTQSGRAILVDAENGHVLREHSIPYPHGVIADGLASAEDYETVLLQLLENVLTEEYRDSVLSICVDATSLTSFRWTGTVSSSATERPLRTGSMPRSSCGSTMVPRHRLMKR